MELSNREIAILVWVAVVISVIFLGGKKGLIGKEFNNILRTFFVPQIIAVLAWASLWIVFCVQILRYVGVWEITNLKTTLLWAVTFAFVTLFDIDRISENDTYFHKTLRDIVSGTVVITFIAEAYNFPLVVELIFVPLIALMVGVQVYSERRHGYASAHKSANAILVVTGLGYVGYGLYKVVTDFRSFATWDTFREFFLPMTLSILFLPFLYIISVLESYKLVFVGLRSAIKNEDIRQYAALQAVAKFRFDLEGLRRWKRHVGVFRPASREGIRNSIAEVKANQRRERNPPPVSPEIGWCPIAATRFLMEHKLTAGDYHRIDDGEWWASSPMLELNEATTTLPDNIAYYVEGDQNVAKRLKVKLNVNDRKRGDLSDSQFREICSTLLRAVILDISHEQQERLLQSDNDDTKIGNQRVRIEKKSFGNPARGYSRMLIIEQE